MVGTLGISFGWFALGAWSASVCGPSCSQVLHQDKLLRLRPLLHLPWLGSTGQVILSSTVGMLRTSFGWSVPIKFIMVGSYTLPFTSTNDRTLS